MAAWFGHTQTLTSISKSVTSVANGILGLEANLATFMQKVTYYDTFFQRVGENLPPEVVKSASRLFARCYEYRNEIRDELESSLAYVADAGRWVIGMEDWNSKMEKRLAQISELVLLANSLLVEYAISGRRGAHGSREQLHAYLQHIDTTVVLQHSERVVAKPSVSTASSDIQDGELVSVAKDANPLFNEEETTATKAYENPLFPQPTSSSSTTEEELVLARTSAAATSVEHSHGGEENIFPPLPPQNDDDDDALNPFAQAYQPPVSIESSLASLRGDSENGSVYYNAVEGSITLPAESQSPSTVVDGDGPDSPVSMGEYECLEIDSIPKYVAFRPSVLSKKRRLQRFFGDAPSPPSSSDSNSNQSSLHPTPPAERSPKKSPQARNRPATKSAAENRAQRQQRLMDLTYSYDFQRELTFNPFASPAMAPAETEVSVEPLRLESTPVAVIEEGREEQSSRPVGGSGEPEPVSGAVDEGDEQGREQEPPSLYDYEEEEEEEEEEEVESDPVAQIPETTYGHRRQDDRVESSDPVAVDSTHPEVLDTTIRVALESSDPVAENRLHLESSDSDPDQYALPEDASLGSTLEQDDGDMSAAFLSPDGPDELSRILDLLTPDDNDHPFS